MQSIVQQVQWRSRARAYDVALRYLQHDAADIVLTAGELDAAARNIAASLTAIAPGERALLLYPPGPDFAAAFLGCLYARIVPVPLPVPKPYRLERQVESVARDCAASLLLTNAIAAQSVARSLAGPALPPLRVTGLSPSSEGVAWDGPAPSLNDAAFIQYTSGATAAPKGVLVTHGNLAANVAAIAFAFRLTPADVCVTWLPHYHDMGLIGTLLVPLAIGVSVILLSPLDMLRRPLRWLDAVSRFGASISGAPPFGYERCLSRISPADRSGLDLSTWRLAFVGAEPVRPSLLERFCATYGPYGFRRAAMYPCYGLAECTLLASGGAAGEGFKRSRSERDASICGGPMPEHRLLIVDPVSRQVVAPGAEGEIWLSGPSVAAGYWGRTHETEAVFRARLAEGDPALFLRTGDLGRAEPEGLVITGRLKDMIIVAARNHHAEDIERSAQTACPELPAGGIAAFAVDAGDVEALVLMVESADGEGLRLRLREAIAAGHDLAIHDILFVAAGHLPRTTSGKISRKACQTLYHTYLQRRVSAPQASAAAV
jgi:acyl-CoA synthetase (AMP-forming)/AMP-acid ligase II